MYYINSGWRCEDRESSKPHVTSVMVAVLQESEQHKPCKIQCLRWRMLLHEIDESSLYIPDLEVSKNHVYCISVIILHGG